MTPTERARLASELHFVADRLRGIASRLDSGERDNEFIEAGYDGVALRCLVVDLLREVAESCEGRRGAVIRSRQWIRLTPKAEPRRARPPDQEQPPPRRGSMSWRIDPESSAATALRELRRKLNAKDGAAS